MKHLAAYAEKIAAMPEAERVALARVKTDQS